MHSADGITCPQPTSTLQGAQATVKLPLPAAPTAAVMTHCKLMESAWPLLVCCCQMSTSMPFSAVLVITTKLSCWLSLKLTPPNSISLVAWPFLT